MFFAFVCLQLCVNAQEVLYSCKSTFAPSNEYIDPFSTEIPRDTSPYIPKKSQALSFDDKKDYDVLLLRYNGWENEPGSYNVFRIRHSKKTIMELRNNNGWEYFYTNNDFVRDSMGFRLICDSICPVKEIPLSVNSTALVLTGATIMSQPPLLSVIVISNGTAKTVFNKEAYINGVKENNGATEFHLQMNTIEYQDNIPSEEPILKTLTFKNGTIYYQ